ncbi:hypothetical protein [Streptomyces sp. SAI-149]|uniref:hypothetical protein n=1 Tax=Streptomyces sp. SAI-149 TaxID=2940542 RepID=UPI0024760CF3|nr:hypothetical protein [Streptomyces sp. SAI-149]MDH6502438.1 hypothetical protein [Streptomyces sp. SAI-149]
MITLPLTPEQRTVYWTVNVHDQYGSAHRSTGLHASAVRQQYDFWHSKPATARVELTEHTLVQARTITTFEDLPGEGEAAPLPDLPAGAHEVKRFFRFALAREDGSLTGFGPAVLRTGDDVRRFYNWTVSTQDHAQAVHVDLSALRVLDITLTHLTREIQLDDLPDDFTASLMGQLETEGLCWVPDHTGRGTYLRIHLAGGSQITISDAAANGREADSQRAAGDVGGWLAVWSAGNDVLTEVYRSRRGLTRAADTVALTDAVLKCAREHGGGPILRDKPRQPHV